MQNEYTVTLTIDTTASSFEEAAQDFAEYLATNGGYTVTVAQNGPYGIEDVTQVEVR